MAKSVHHLDLHPIAKNSEAIEQALRESINAAVEKRIATLEIIPGKGSGQLMNRVKRFLDQKDIRILYKRVVVDAKNHGRLFVHFR
jgi:dsDNA-specific endonuclease/ATPase MutS2